jgi:Ca-activated chloride channel family protein
MEHEEIEALLRDKTGAAIALKGVAARVNLRGLLGEVEVEQRYLNTKDSNIEAVYTFPLPMGATLLALEVEIDGRVLSGQIVEKQQAEAAYEDAITDGDTAVMLQDAGPGLYTMNVGNLLASESCVIRYRYGMPLQWQGEHLRLLLPTTIAPRYGTPSPMEMQPHQVPITSATVGYPFSIDIEAEGLLATAEVTSPTHTLAVAARDGKLHIALAQAGAMDRDFVLLFKSAQQDSCLLVRDHNEGRDQYIALAAIRIPMHARQQALPLRLNVLIDCSGSMAGASIIQARKAALEILSQLRPGDQFNVTLFGSDHHHLFPKLMAVTPANIATAADELSRLQADMGGTETGSALEACYRMAKKEAKRDADGEALQDSILFITDGQIAEYASLISKAKKSGQRIFSVGVGTVVAEGFVGDIAECTGGAFELVSPQEGMAEVILKQFHRLRQPKIDAVRLEWPVPTLWQTPLPKAVYAGDTVLAWAAFASKPSGDVRLHFSLERELAIPVTPELVEQPNLARMAIAHHIDQLQEAPLKLELALEYQLLTPLTNFLVVAERAEKAETLPQLQQVPQMAPAGWGGAVLAKKRSASLMPSMERSRSAASFDMAFMSAPAVCAAPMMVAGAAMAKEPSNTVSHAPEQAPSAFISNLHKELDGVFDAKQLPTTFSQLEAMGLPQDIVVALQEIMDKFGDNEAQVVIAFLFALSNGAMKTDMVPVIKRLILLGKKKRLPSDALVSSIESVMTAVKQNDWNWPLTVA